ncbi:hypothetical protein [Burkholderia multivorans]|uniref:hypothetical protein n=1 Tax=Burkholderia multivorans TaxID=87883 RepID=UPI00055B65CF|nr:hypothetical protein [Burkholderia multivorans]
MPKSPVTIPKRSVTFVRNTQQAFERFTRDLFAAHWNYPTAEMNGRAGQAQAGVDVYGINFGTGKLEAVQCKGKDGRYGHSVTKEELRAEVKKALLFKPEPSHYYLVTSSAADVAVQEEARLISAAHAAEGKFAVQVFGWEQLLALLQNYPKVARAHFRPLLVALSQIDAPAELIAICHQSFQHACQQQLRSDPLGPLCSTFDLTHLGHQVDAQRVA